MKKLFKILSVLAVLALALPVCFGEETPVSFREEYESLNGQSTWDGEHTYLDVLVPEENPFSYASIDEIERLLMDGTGVLYLGFPECPFCRTLMPVLVEAYQEAGYEGTISCYNCVYDRDYIERNEAGELVIGQVGTTDYYRLLGILYDYCWEYQGLEEPNLHRIYFPMLFFIRDGEVLDVHVDTIEPHCNGDGYDLLSEDEHTRLLELLVNDLHAVEGKE